MKKKIILAFASIMALTGILNAQTLRTTTDTNPKVSKEESGVVKVIFPPKLEQPKEITPPSGNEPQPSPVILPGRYSRKIKTEAIPQSMASGPINKIGSPIGVPSKLTLKPNDGSGIITLDFGIVNQGTTVTTYFPFNYETLETKESIFTPRFSTKNFTKYMKITEAKGIYDVKMATGRYSEAYGLFNGFDVILNTQDAYLGSFDEVVEVFTTLGNLQLRLTGYITSKDTKLTCKN